MLVPASAEWIPILMDRHKTQRPRPVVAVPGSHARPLTTSEKSVVPEQAPGYLWDRGEVSARRVLHIRGASHGSEQFGSRKNSRRSSTNIVNLRPKWHYTIYAVLLVRLTFDSRKPDEGLLAGSKT